MKPVYLFLPDFKAFFKGSNIKITDNSHPMYYIESDRTLRFYKYFKGVWYATAISTKAIPAGFTFDTLKQEFDATELPERPDAPGTVTVSI